MTENKILNFLQQIEENYSSKNIPEIKVGDVIQLSYKILEGDKERLQNFEGLVIAKNNKNLGKSFTLRRTVQGIGVEQIFFFNSPKIVSIIKKQSSKIRRSKLYFLRYLTGKNTRLKSLK